MKKNFLNRLFLLALALVLFLPPLPLRAQGVEDLSREAIAPGVLLREVRWHTGSRYIVVDVLDMDLNNPGFDLEMVAGGGRFTQKATVSQMAQRTGAVALINGDFFDTRLQGAPFGPTVVEGRMTSSSLQSYGLHAFGIDGGRKAHIESVSFSGQVKAPDGAAYPISGFNKTSYGINQVYKDAIHIYDDFWASRSRGRKNSAEILLDPSHRVLKISLAGPLPMVVPSGHKVLQLHGSAVDFARNHIQIGQTLGLDYQLKPDRNWQFMIGGHAKMVVAGRPQVYTLNAQSIGGIRARSAVGISQDGKRVFLASSEGKTQRNSGVRLAEWTHFMKALGSYEAMNLDGGGSTTMVARHPGDFESTLVTRPEGGGGERPIPNGIAVHNTSPQGPLSHLEMTGPHQVVQGEVTFFSPHKGWDDNLHPKDVSQIQYQMSDSLAGPSAWSANRYLSPQVGRTQVFMTTPEGVQAQKSLEVLDPSTLTQIWLEGDPTSLLTSGQASLRVLAKDPSGRTLSLDPGILQWSLEGVSLLLDDQSWKVYQADGSLMGPQVLLSQLAFEEVPYGEIRASYAGLDTQVKINNPAYKRVHMALGQRAYQVDGAPFTMDTSPYISNSRTLVPLRFLMEAYGAQVDWDPLSRTAQVLYAGQDIQVPIGKDYIYINGEAYLMDVTSTIKDSRTMVPLRFISESLGMTVSFYPYDKSIDIYEKR
ncbi:MAG: stalk domain-containing protein [Tissierellia bacterium]|nr:stalk domain-containing protein [Tissierellia bacterium]